MTPLQYITNAATGCCTSKELMEYNKENPGGLEVLKRYAIEEMKNRGVEITERST